MSDSDAQPTDPLLEDAARLLVNNYGPAPLALAHGAGAWVTDTDGRKYLDMSCGISVTSFGHRHAAIEAAVREQLGQLWHVSNLYGSAPVVALAQALVDHSFAQRVFFCNSGSEANEAAIKLARKAASATRGPDQRVILTFEGSFHGRTLAAVTATAQPKYHEGFEPLPGGFRYCAFNDRAALDHALDDSVCAVLVEPIQGEGGVVPAAPGFLSYLRERCDARGAYLLVDEVQCGMGRSGKLWAHEWEDGFVPDAMTLAKALGGGLPIGALLVGPRLADTLQPGSHGSTFGGNPVVCAGANAALALARSPELLANVNRQSERLRSGLAKINAAMDIFDDIRGRGLMLGAQLRDDRAQHLGKILSACRRHGVLVLQAGPRVLRLLPPLILSDTESDTALEAIEHALHDVFGSHD